MMEDEKQEPVTCFICPPLGSCLCNCGTDEPPVCEHVWNGESVEFDDGQGYTATCSRCGMWAVDHDVRCGP